MSRTAATFTPAPDSVGIVAPRRVLIDAPLSLDCGRMLPRHELMVETYGTLNAERSHAILICHALSGEPPPAAVHDPDDPKSGRWDNYTVPATPNTPNTF